MVFLLVVLAQNPVPSEHGPVITVGVGTATFVGGLLLRHFLPSRGGGANGNGGRKHVTKEFCEERSGNIREDLKHISNKLDRLLENKE